MKHEDAQVPPADAGRLETPVRPRAWLGPSGQSMPDEIYAAWAPSSPADAQHYVPLYDRAALDAAVAAEREQCAKIADEHARRNYPWGSENTDRYHAQADWAERIAAAIRGPNVRGNWRHTAPPMPAKGATAGRRGASS